MSPSNWFIAYREQRSPSAALFSRVNRDGLTSFSLFVKPDEGTNRSRRGLMGLKTHKARVQTQVRIFSTKKNISSGGLISVFFFTLKGKKKKNCLEKFLKNGRSFTLNCKSQNSCITVTQNMNGVRKLGRNPEEML